jgi:hypothetical protein
MSTSTVSAAVVVPTGVAARAIPVTRVSSQPARMSLSCYAVISYQSR